MQVQPSRLFRFKWPSLKWGFVALCLLVIGCGDSPDDLSREPLIGQQGLIEEAVFVRAIYTGDNETVEQALHEEMNPNAKNRYGDTALIWAVYRDRIGLVRILLKKGANPNIAGTYNKAPMHWAAENNLVQHMVLLLDQGAKIDIYDKQFRTPLHAAVKKGHIGAVRFLVEHGADPNWTNDKGESPLYVAVRNDLIEAVEILVLAGADPNKKTSDGSSPLSYAIKTDRQRYFQTLAIRQKKQDLADQIQAKITTIQVNGDAQPKLNPKGFALLLHDKVNLVRQDEGLPMLAYHEDLARAARAHCVDMVRRDFFDHVNPSGENPLQRCQLIGFEPPDYSSGERVGFGIGENIFQCVVYTSRSSNTSAGIRYLTYDWMAPESLAGKVVAGWMESPGHRRNILNPEFTHQGFGIATEGFKVWVAQNFYYPMGLTKIVDGRAQKPTYNLTVIAQTIHSSVNRLRSDHKRSLLIWDDNLVGMAAAHGRDMIKRDFFAHLNPDGEDVTDRAIRANYPQLGHRTKKGDRRSGLGENLSKGQIHEGQSTATVGKTRFLDYDWMSQEALVAKAIQEWWSSPGHRANMLNGNYERSGVAVMIDEKDRIYIVHNFF